MCNQEIPFSSYHSANRRAPPNPVKFLKVSSKLNTYKTSYNIYLETESWIMDHRLHSPQSCYTPQVYASFRRMQREGHCLLFRSGILFSDDFLGW